MAYLMHFRYGLWKQFQPLEIFWEKKISKELIQFPRCSNWTGAAKVSYWDIIQFERKILKTEAPIYPYISFAGNFDILDSTDYSWSDEVDDVEVGILKYAINRGTDFREHIWESIQHGETFNSQTEQVGKEVDNQSFEEENEAANSVDSNIPLFESRSRKKRVADIGAEQRKRQVLCQQTVGDQQGISEDTKSFIQGIFDAVFSTLEAKLDKIIDEKIGKLDSDYLQFKNSVIEQIKNAETTTVPKPSVGNKSQPKDGVSKKKSSLRSR